MFTLLLHHKLQPYHFYLAKVVNFFLLQKLSHFYYAPWQNFTIKLSRQFTHIADDDEAIWMLKINKQTSVQKNSFSFSCVQILQDVKREREKLLQEVWTLPRWKNVFDHFFGVAIAAILCALQSKCTFLVIFFCILKNYTPSSRLN